MIRCLSVDLLTRIPVVVISLGYCLTAYYVLAEALRHFNKHRLVGACHGIDRKADTAKIRVDHLLNYYRHLEFIGTRLPVHEIAQYDLAEHRSVALDYLLFDIVCGSIKERLILTCERKLVEVLLSAAASNCIELVLGDQRSHLCLYLFA